VTNNQLQQALHRLDLVSNEAAQLLSVSVRTVQRWLEGEEIPGPVEQALRAWLLLHERRIPWRPDGVSLERDDRDQIARHREHAIDLSEALRRVEARGGCRVPWEVDRVRCCAVLGPVTVSFHKLRNGGGFSLAWYTRRDRHPDLARDKELIEEASYCIAEAMKKEPDYGPVVLVYHDRRPLGTVKLGSPARQKIRPFDTNESAMEWAFERMGKSNFVDPFIAFPSSGDSAMEPKVLWTTRELMAEYEHRGQDDFEIKWSSGRELLVTTLSERGQRACRLKIGHSIAFTTRGELIPYVSDLELRGLKFRGKELLTPSCLSAL